MPKICSTANFLLQRNFWLLILIEKINSKEYIKMLSKSTRIPSIPIMLNNKINPNSEDFVSKPIISITVNNINSNMPQAHKILKA
ncbi:hypothetical protein IJZ97_04510 [bacterium]|nr:hypothetical protein [bacterium]